MGVIITAAGYSDRTVTPSTPVSVRSDAFATGTGAVEHLARAGRTAIDAAGVPDHEVSALINTGVYRDSNMVEPAIGALVQQGIGLGLEYERTDPKVFSFDLMNGACGMLNAVQVADSLLATTRHRRVLVVGGDTHPSTTRPDADDDFPYDTAGSALLLEQVDGDAGFGRLHTRLGAGDPLVEGFVDGTSMGTEGRQLMTVRRTAGFDTVLLDLAESTAVGALDEAFGAGHSDEAREGVVLISSRPTAGFAADLAARLRLPLAAPELTGDTHTAALAQGYRTALTAGALDSAKAILFVAAGGGPSAGAVLYRLPENLR
ncbi:MAG: hypothetical protein QM774_10540 [Gordonia sp. (in: high G+C Gram-positive bacteria)]|uniref:hypothetical protein n=1 Tax=Gordonia sp. (in: high G+C Gram-positive bacteria) TaxID=84139 RepID=UPI0039E54B82